MSNKPKTPQTLTDEDIVTSAKLSRRTLLAGAGVALGAAALARGGRSAHASENDMSDKSSKGKGDKAEKDKSTDKSADKASKDKEKKSKIETTRDKD
jgi:hypothetical protein